jgi:cytochrome c-type biogenesis protein CcmH
MDIYILYILFAIMIAASLIWLAWYLYHPLKDNSLDIEKSNTLIDEQKKQELQADLQLNLIDPNQFDNAKNDITKNSNSNLNPTDTYQKKVKKKPIYIIGFLVIFIITSSFGFYKILSNYEPVNKAQDNIKQYTIIENYLAENPQDALAWHALAIIYSDLNEQDKAIQAYEKSYQLDSQNQELLTEYAAILASNTNTLSGRPIELINQALEINPYSPDALYLAGIHAVSLRDFNSAQSFWQRSLSLLPADSQYKQVVKNLLNELSQMIKEEEINHKEDGLDYKDNFITIKVTFSDEILSSRSQNDYVMIYVKADKKTPMPIAIKKIKLKDFSNEVVLKDIDSIIPSRKLSQFKKVIAVARISKTGNAIKQEDDIEVISDIIHVEKNPIINLEFK